MENKDLLLSFVASMLEVPPESISDIQLISQEMPPDDPEGKFSRLDLNMYIDGKIIRPAYKNVHDRMSYVPMGDREQR